MDNELNEIRERAEIAKEIIDGLHTERLDYTSEYLPLINSNNDIDTLIRMIKELQKDMDAAEKDMTEMSREAACRFCKKEKECPVSSDAECEFEWRGRSEN